MEPSEDRVLAALDRLVLAAVGVTTVALAESGEGHDLTLSQWRALVVISSSTGLRASELAQRIGMSRPSMSRLVRRLERRGVIVAEQDPNDGRATILRATSTGVSVRVAMMARRRELMTDALAARPGSLPRDLASGLDAIAEVLERYT
jgi:DNA-binding MarR family transcriptional regulator